MEPFITNYVLPSDNECKPDKLNQNLGLSPLMTMIEGRNFQISTRIFFEMHSMSPGGKFRSLFGFTKFRSHLWILGRLVVDQNLYLKLNVNSLPEIFPT